MIIRQIEQFSEISTKAHAYFCQLMVSNLPNRRDGITADEVMSKMRKITGELRKCEGIYLLDKNGVKVTPTYRPNGEKDELTGQSHVDRAYFHLAMKEKSCVLTDPYPSQVSQELTVTASQPIMDEKGEVEYVACLDIPLQEVLHIAHPMALDTWKSRFFAVTYGLFAVVLAAVALLLFVKGVEQFVEHGFDFRHIEIEDIFEATILLTLALAIFDLSKTLIDEEVMGSKDHHAHDHAVHKTMIRFLGSIVIALSIEALMLVFKFAMTDPKKLEYAIWLIGGVGLLLIGMAIYIKFTRKE